MRADSVSRVIWRISIRPLVRGKACRKGMPGSRLDRGTALLMLVGGKACPAGNGQLHWQVAQRGHGTRGERPSGTPAERLSA